MEQPAITKSGSRVTTMEVAVHYPNMNPSFAEGVICVRVDDEGGGPFIVIAQDFGDKENKIRIDIDELPVIIDVAKKLVREFEKNISCAGAGGTSD